MTEWLPRHWTPAVIAVIGLGVGTFQAVQFSDLPDALPRLIVAEAILAVAFGLVLALAARDGCLHQRLDARARRFRDIAASAADWLWETGPDLRFTYLSANFREATGQDPALVLGRNGIELGIGQEVPAHKGTSPSTPTTPRPFRDHLYSVPLPSREPFLFRASGVPVFDAAGRFQGYRGVASDITATALAERKARRLEADLVRAQRMETLGAFAGGIAHDVNNALLPILTMIRSLMRRLGDQPREHESLALAFEAAERCRDLVSEQLAQIRKENVSDIVIDLKDPAADAIAVLRRALPRGVRLVTEIEPVPMPVICAPVKILQVVAHLITNAAQAIGEAPLGGEIRLRVAASGDLDGYLIEVGDDGPGIPADLRDKIFEPFFTTKPAAVGTGLGLSTVLSLVRGLDGKVSFVSRPGKGATFIVFLPRATAEAMEASLADAREPERQP